MIKDLELSLKLVFSPIKILICIAIAALTPLVIKSMSLYEFYRSFAIYISIIGIIVFADIPLIDTKSGMNDIMYLAKKKTWETYFYRITAGLLGISILVLLSGYIFVLRLSYEDMLIFYDIKSQLRFLINLMPYIMFLGLVSMSITNAIRSAKFGYTLSILYWLANLIYREEYIIQKINNTNTLIYIMILSLIMIIINLYLDSLKPLKRGSLAKILKIKQVKSKMLYICKEYDILDDESY